jgi:hypothetical protein
MRRTQAERQAEAARAKQLTEQAQQHVQDRKTGEWYDPKEAFDQMMNTPEVMASLKRLTVR